MRIVLNVGAVLLCGALAGFSALTQSAPVRAASVSDDVHLDAIHQPDANEIEIRRSSGTIEAHFAAANTTHDGHLTRQQAQLSDWPRVVKHFDEIDTDHKGWITAAQIHAFNKSHRKHRTA